MRDVGKDLRNLQLALLESNDKSIYYISRSFGNKYIVPQEEYEKLNKENAEYKEVLSLIFKKQVDINLIMQCETAERYNKYLDTIYSYKELNDEQFNKIKRCEQ